MPVSTTVTLPADVDPKFPDRCIVCHGVPDSTVKISHHSQNPFLAFYFPILMFFGWSRLTIPVCRKCKPRYRLQRWARELTIIALAFAAVWLVMPYFQSWKPIVRKTVGGLLALLVISPYFLFEVFWPRFLDTTGSKRSIDYDFASLEYAACFHLLNKDRVLKSEVNPMQLLAAKFSALNSAEQDSAEEE